MADKMRTDSGPRPSITSHPLFPVIVVLWCGALFGMASLAIRTELIEHAVIAAGFDGMVPMAAPPLGRTARILIALLATGLGCLVGLLVIRRFTKPLAEAPARRRRTTANVDSPEAEAVQVAEAEQAPVAAPLRRRRFSMAREEQADLTDPVPVPGAQILNVADLDLDLDAFEPESEAPRWTRNIDADDETRSAAGEPAQGGGTSLFDSYVRGRKPDAEPEVPEPGFELLSHADGEDAQVGPREPTHAEPSHDAFSHEQALHSSVQPDWRPSAQGSAAERIASAPLDDLSPIELLERLALTIERRRAVAKARAEAARNEAEALAQVPYSPVEQAFEPAQVPAALRPIDPEAEDAADEPLPGYVPPRHIGLSASAAPVHAAMLASDEDVLAEGYSSLRNLSRPASAAPVPAQRPLPARFDAPAGRPSRAVYPFPTQPDSETEVAPDASKRVRAFDAPASTGVNTEAELRTALATLQRMSGAA